MRWIQLHMVLILGLVGLASCGTDSPGTGAVGVSWMVEGATCELAGLTTVRLDLLQDGELLDSQEGSCSAGSLVLEGVTEGRYDLYLAGLDPEDNVLYEASYEGLKVVAGDTPSTPPSKLLLSMKLGVVKLRWTLPAENPMCSFNDIADVEVSVLQDGSMFSLYHQLFPCDPGTSEDLPSPLVGGWIEISNILPGDVKLVLYGINSQDERVFKGEAEATVEISAPVEVSVPLTACDNGCI